jgi:hypothetical protein
MADRSSSTFTIPGNNGTFVGAVPQSNVVLRGLSLSYDGFGKPRELEGKQKLEDDMKFIIHRVLSERGLLKTTFNEADLGNLSKLLSDELESSENWWLGQAVPVSLSELKITLRDVEKLDGVSFDRGNAEGLLMIVISYTERSKGVDIRTSDGNTLYIPFDSFYGGNA